MDVYLSGWNEYHALLATCLGMVAHAASVLRSWRQTGRLALLVVLCVVPGWFLSEPGDRAFSLPVAWALCFGVGFAATFRNSILPLVTAAGVIHFVLLTYYALYLSAAAAGVTLPGSIVFVGVAPGVLLALGSLMGLLRRSWFRTLAYVGYLGSMVLLILVSEPLEYLRATYVDTGFSAELYVVAFLLGGVALALCSHTVQLLLLVPAWERPGTRVLLDAILGESDLHREQAGLMADRHLGGGIDAVGTALLLCHALVLALTLYTGWGSPAVVVQASIASLTWLVMPWEAARRLQNRPAREGFQP